MVNVPPFISSAISAAATAAPIVRPTIVRHSARRESSRSAAATKSVTPPRLRSANFTAAPRASGASAADSSNTSDQTAAARCASGSARHQTRGLLLRAPAPSTSKASRHAAHKPTVA